MTDSGKNTVCVICNKFVRKESKLTRYSLENIKKYANDWAVEGQYYDVNIRVKGIQFDT